MRDRIKENGSGVLWNILRRYTLLLTPFAPFTAESVWKRLECDEQHPLQVIMPAVEMDKSGYATDVTRMLTAIEKVRQLRDLKGISAKKPIMCAELDMVPLEGDCLDIFMTETNIMNVIWNMDRCNVNCEETEEVINEYILRLMKREVYNKRKEWGLKITDKTSFTLSGNSLSKFAHKNMGRMEEMFGEYNGPILHKFGDVELQLVCGNVSVEGTIYLYKHGIQVQKFQSWVDRGKNG